MYRVFLSAAIAGVLSVASVTAAQEKSDGAARLSAAEAATLVRAAVLVEKPNLSSAASFPLTELTTDEIWQRLGAQVFQVNDGLFQFDTYLIERNEVMQLGKSFGGMGLTSMKVTDLDRDGAAELAFTFSWGSGIHRSQVGLYSPELSASSSLEANVAYFGADWILERRDDHTVFLTVENAGKTPPSIRIGQLQIEKGKSGPRLIFKVDEHLPSEFSRLVE